VRNDLSYQENTELFIDRKTALYIGETQIRVGMINWWHKLIGGSNSMPCINEWQLLMGVSRIPLR